MRARRWVWGAVVGVAAGAVLAVGMTWHRQSRQGPKPERPTPEAVVDESSSLEVLAEGLGRGNRQALAVLHQRIVKEQATTQGYGQVEGDRWLGVLAGLRGGFPKFGRQGREQAVEVAGRVLERFGFAPVPPDWSRALAPVHDLLAAAQVDAVAEVRATTQKQISRFWVWSPSRNRDLFPVEEQALTAWKEGLHALVIRGLADADPRVRAEAVTCLGALPIDSAAAPALAYLADREPVVRQRVLFGFANRRELLPEESILPLLFDPEVKVALTASEVLKARGLTETQIELGRMVFHQRPTVRASAVSQLMSRRDIDPDVWLLHLSRDPAETVRVEVVAALSHRSSPAPSPDLRARLEEMALTDPSPRVREAAGKLVPTATDSTAALPPLPGSPSLNPKAN